MKDTRKWLLGFFVVGVVVVGPVLAEKGTKPVLPIGCQQGEVAKWNGEEWVCAADNDSLPSITCPDGWIPKASGLGWECVEDPTDRVAALEVASQPDTLTVDCGGGESIQSTLDEIVGWRAAPVTILVSGFCDEDVYLTQSNIAFLPAAGSTGTGFGFLSISGAHGIRVGSLRLARGLEVGSGGSFEAWEILVDSPQAVNVTVFESSFGRLSNPTLTNCGIACIEVRSGANLRLDGGTLGGTAGQGVVINDGGSIDIVGTEFRGLRSGIGIAKSGSAYIQDATIEELSETAIAVSGHVNLVNTQITNNSAGAVEVRPGGSANIEGGTITGNGWGITARKGVLEIVNTTISGNSGPGIAVYLASSVSLFNARIENNIGDGVNLGDLSIMEVSGGPTLVNGNTGYGVRCSQGAPAAAQYIDSGTSSGDPALVAQSNGVLDIDCPLGH